ncbi:WEAK CHLOROPLAST MOVEMENT UNDER BLUE LIGHT 1 [Hibiscus trionum]|uniref:WEAK CHLOROPLAST MOVEMENT UNDER BLUE LIGHT 1 n=1 Tax=Hibiscus trionum TaxID=183268 RepID=A0A9W7HJW8_HIBTR|nr:WEAK CHLOROPLAST MOVEMENT UNDER BLUE LIGHT 1 [Hibiscus trionum]
MGEVDTKPIEPVQVAISLFGEKSNQSRPRSTGSDSDTEKENGVEGLEKGLANYRLQMEAKDSAYMEVLRQLEHYKKTAHELSVLLKNSEVERYTNIQECNLVKDRINELESKMKGMVDKLSESAKIREQLSCVLMELKITQADLLNMESQLAAAKDLELKAITQAEMMETSAKMEKERSEELLGRITELQDATQLAATKAEDEKCRIVSEKDAEMEAFKATILQAQEEMEDLGKRLETIPELENQLAAKSALQAKLEQVPNVLGSMENASLDGGNDLNQITQDLEFKKRKISDQAFYIKELETELKRLELELENTKKEAKNLNCNVEALKSDLEKLQIEMDEVRKREKDEQVEISHIYDQRDKCVDHIMISIEEYNSLIRKTEKADEISRSPAEDFNQLTTESANKSEVDALKKELRAAMAKIGLFRNRAEQAATRAEAAEKAKATAEDQLRKWQEQKQRRKAALAALREESAPKQFNPPTIEKLPTNHQPLGQVLNLKF